MSCGVKKKISTRAREMGGFLILAMLMLFTAGFMFHFWITFKTIHHSWKLYTKCNFFRPNDERQELVSNYHCFWLSDKICGTISAEIFLIPKFSAKIFLKISLSTFTVNLVRYLYESTIRRHTTLNLDNYQFVDPGTVFFLLLYQSG